MDIPDWAERALEHFRPKPAYGEDEPDPGRKKQWEGFSNRFRQRWKDLSAEDWNVPTDHRSYAWLRREYLYPPEDYVRQCILECAIECAWELGAGKDPESVIEAVRELDGLNEKISGAAAGLAALFRQRQQLLDDYQLSDRFDGEEEGSPDPFKLLGAMEITLSSSRFRSGSFYNRDALQAFFAAMRSSGSMPPAQWPDLLDQVAWRHPRIVTPMDAGDLAIIGSKTKRSKWSPWGLRLIARLGDWAGNGLPDGFFLACLTNEQLALLAEVSCDAPADAFNADQMRKLKERYATRRGSKDD